ncbi:MAG: hypothetical protein AAB358_04000 [Patescibacteria group bacterium]
MLINDPSGNLIEGRIKLVDVLPHGVQPIHTENPVSTDKKGLLVCFTEFSARKVKLLFAVQGCQADTGKKEDDCTLEGPEYQRPTGASFKEAVQARRRYNLGL